jgi:hypothetical protein
MAFVSYSMCNEDIMMRFVDFDIVHFFSRQKAKSMEHNRDRLSFGRNN